MLELRSRSRASHFSTSSSSELDLHFDCSSISKFLCYRLGVWSSVRSFEEISNH